MGITTYPLAATGTGAYSSLFKITSNVTPPSSEGVFMLRPKVGTTATPPKLGTSRRPSTGQLAILALTAMPYQGEISRVSGTGDSVVAVSGWG